MVFHRSKDVLFISLSLIDVLKQMKSFGNGRSETSRNKYRGSTLNEQIILLCLNHLTAVTLRLESPNKYILGYMTICFVGSSFCLPEKKPDNKRNHQLKPFPIRIGLIHRLKTRMIPFKNAKKKIQNFAEKVMQIVTLFVMPLSYIAFKELDFDKNGQICH